MSEIDVLSLLLTKSLPAWLLVRSCNPVITRTYYCVAPVNLYELSVALVVDANEAGGGPCGHIRRRRVLMPARSAGLTCCHQCAAQNVAHLVEIHKFDVQVGLLGFCQGQRD